VALPISIQPPAAWIERAAPLLAAAARIEERGGRVMFVRLPISGRIAELFAQHYPRATYWDAFAARAHRAAHFADDARMRAVQCPDEMHVDERDQAAVTTWLAGVIDATATLRPSGP